MLLVSFFKFIENYRRENYKKDYVSIKIRIFTGVCNMSQIITYKVIAKIVSLLKTLNFTESIFACHERRGEVIEVLE